MEQILIVTGILLVIVVLMLLASYNSLMDQRQHIRTAWAQMDEQLKHRYELVPQLLMRVNSIGGEPAAKLPAVAAAKNQAAVAFNPTQLAAAESALSIALHDVLVSLGDSPALADLRQNFLSCEKQIDKARKYYNDQVDQLNESLASFPTAITALLIGLKRQPGFELPQAPEV